MTVMNKAKHKCSMSVDERLAEFKRLMESIHKALEEAGATEEKVLRTLPKVRRMLYERRYGKHSRLST